MSAPRRDIPEYPYLIRDVINSIMQELKGRFMKLDSPLFITSFIFLFEAYCVI